MAQATSIIDYWVFLVKNEQDRYEDIKIYGDSANNKREATRLMREQCKERGYRFISFQRKVPVYTD